MFGSYKPMSVVVALLATTTLGMTAYASDAAKEVIRVRGSDSVAEMVDSLAREFMKTHPNCNVVVSGGSSVGDSFSALFNREAELVMQSNDLDMTYKQAAEQKGVNLLERVIGWGGLAIIVNPSNPVNELTVDQVRNLFSGRYDTWKQVGGSDEPVTVLTVGENRLGTLEFFTKAFLKAPLAPNAVTKVFFRSIIPAVEESKTATGYIRIRNIVQLKEKNQESRVKIVAVKKDESSPAVLPSRETVDNGTYPITRPYYLYTDGKTDSSAKAFLEFCAAKNPR